jgi:hypothetical protein
MTILENSILHLSTILIFIIGLGLLLLSYLKKNYQFANFGFGITLTGFFITVFIGALRGDFFVLSYHVEYLANVLFTLSSCILGIISIASLVFYYRHRVIPAMFLQLGIALSATIIVVTLTTSINQSLASRRKSKTEIKKFLRAEEFQKGSPNPSFSRINSKKDSIMAR